MKFRRTAAALGACASIALALTACSSGDAGGDNASAPTTTATASQTDGSASGSDSDLPPTPTVDELNQQLQTALDPDVPAEQKAQLVTGLDEDPQLIQKLSDQVAQAEADGSLTDVEVTGPILPPTGTTLTVPFTATFNGQPQQGQATLLAVDGKWRLDGDFLCGLAKGVGIDSPACMG